MGDYHRETVFLKESLLYDRSTERDDLVARVTRLQRDERCVRRAVWLMTFLVAMALAGLCYSAIFLADYPLTVSRFLAPLTVKIFAALSVASLICLLAFVGLWMVYRRELDQQRQQCRRSITNLLESQLGTASGVRARKARIAVNGNKVSAVGLDDRGATRRPPL